MYKHFTIITKAIIKLFISIWWVAKYQSILYPLVHKTVFSWSIDRSSLTWYFELYAEQQQVERIYFDTLQLNQLKQIVWWWLSWWCYKGMFILILSSNLSVICKVAKYIFTNCLFVLCCSNTLNELYCENHAYR